MMGFFSGNSSSASDRSAKPESIFDKYAIDRTKKYGEGGYGATFAAVEKASGQPLACKLIDMRRMREDAILKECKILEILTHPNVISVKAHGGGVTSADRHIYYIFMELASGGELFDQVIDRGAAAMDEPTARGFFGQMIDGIAYCHLAGVAHRDLKLENVLLNEQGVIKVIDFGLSHVYPKLPDGGVDRSTRLHDVCGSKSYAAPEVLANTAQGYDGYAADMWSLGVSIFAMLSGFFPLDEATGNDWRFPKLLETQRRNMSTVSAVYSWYKRQVHLSPEVVHMINGLLTIDPSKRMTMEQLRMHPWIVGTKFGGAAGADQGSFHPGLEVGDGDGPTFRGFQGGLSHDDHEAYMEDDDMPVMGVPTAAFYTSTTSFWPASSAATERAPVPSQLLVPGRGAPPAPPPLLPTDLLLSMGVSPSDMALFH
jgi:serine/threonine protein kinase